MADDLSDGNAFFNKKQYGSPLLPTGKRPLKGASRHTMLAVMYHEGLDVKKDDAQKAYWFRKGAEQGHAQAQYNPGVLYERGIAVKQDDARAADLFRKAAYQGNPGAKQKLKQNGKPPLQL